ncbi:MAG: hypothetical protein JWM31_1657 [Solirubrobacterales bacterium]|nr:hypothetical protein [Solirubrobacterales bacterium]
MSERRRAPKRRVSVGVLGFAGILAMLVVVYFSFAKRVPFIHGYRVQGVFSNTSQLRKSSPVRIAGVDVGKVVKISKGEGTTAEVQLELKDSALPLHRDATLRVRPRLFLEGGFYVELRVGSPSAPELKDGGTIPLGQTSVPVQFDQVLSSLDHPTRDSLKRTIANLAEGTDNGAAKAFGDAAKPFTPALRDVAQVAQAARGIGRHDLSETIASLGMITGTLAANDRALGNMVSGLSTTSGALAAEQDNLRATVRGIDRLTRTATPSLVAIDRALPSVKTFADALRPSLPQAPQTLRDTTALLRAVRPLVRPAELPALLTKLTPTVNRLPTLSVRLRALFPLVTPVSDCVRERVTPVLKTQINDGKLSTGRPVWQDLLHAAVGLAGASQDFDGNGPGVRYLAAVGPQSIATGSLPGLEQLVGSGPKVEGSTPRWLGNGRLPAFRPDAQCRTATPVDLQARTPFPAAGASARTVKATRAAERQAVVRASEHRIGERPATPSVLHDALHDVARAAAALSRKAGR